ncbi:hypothetical protein [Bosea psychrotolerans]|uniref:Uncharacterized protein n=1 Tax=Bosea psychrotolerans TaxID=1871628 RepID=A0A2S4LZZ9_9HYPH|nr:hypothetical protein [Bosea psychrotolerans]POR48044.1 hypothetical protein CYD53_11667 [Bosea psychrotolerans]
MITTFILLGLAFLGGGAAAIVDGWPYLVLERGFTEVIIGAIAATAGLLMLMLSYVLVEIRRVRTNLSNAVLAASLASMAGGEPVPLEGAAHRDQGSAGAAAGLGLAAGAGAAVLAGSAAHAAQPGVSPEAEPAAEHEPDFFGELLAHEEASSAAAEAASSAPVDAPKAVEPSQAEPAMAEEEAKEPAPEAADADKAEPTAEAAAEPLQAKAKASIETEAEPHGSAQIDLESSFEDVLHWPEPEPRSRESAASSMTGLDDEFGALRDSLSKRLQFGEPGAASAPAETETPLSAIRDPEAIESAAAWMAPPSRKHDSWFPDDGEAHDDAQDPAPTPAEAPQAEAELPPWPPVTHGVEVPAPEHEAEPAAVAAAASEAPEDEAGPDEAASAPHGKEAPEEEASAAAPPAASEEGIVGAYQVGDAHFTIFADGSIKARTPDGDYNFASMDELKIYLASEKSRLGV